MLELYLSNFEQNFNAFASISSRLLNSRSERMTRAWSSLPTFHEFLYRLSMNSIPYTRKYCPPFSHHHTNTCSSAATKHRSVGATNLNRASSRSHAVLTIEATMLDPIANTSIAINLNSISIFSCICFQHSWAKSISLI